MASATEESHIQQYCPLRLHTPTLQHCTPVSWAGLQMTMAVPLIHTVCRHKLVLGFASIPLFHRRLRRRRSQRRRRRRQLHLPSLIPRFPAPPTLPAYGNNQVYMQLRPALTPPQAVPQPQAAVANAIPQHRELPPPAPSAVPAPPTLAAENVRAMSRRAIPQVALGCARLPLAP